MKTPNEVHCHVGSFDAASTPDAFIKRELELGTGTVVVTDHGTMTSCVDIYTLAKKNKLIPIMGLEAYIRDDECSILTAAGIEKDKKGTFKDYANYFHTLIHARDQKTFEFLGLKLSNADARAEVHGSERKPIFGWTDLEEIAGYNVTISSGCLIGVYGRHFLNGRPDLGEKYYEKVRGIVGPKNFVVEIFPHDCSKKYVSGVFIGLEDGQELKYWKGKKVRVEYRGKTEDIGVEELTKRFTGKNVIGWKLIAVKNKQSWSDFPTQLGIRSARLVEDFISNDCTPECPDGDVQAGMNRMIYQLAKKHGDRIYVSGDSHYANADEFAVQDIKLINASGGLRFTPGYHRQSGDESFQFFRAKMGITEKEFESWTENSREWADSFKDFNLDSPISLPTKFYPEDTTRHLKSLIDKHGRMHWDNQEWVNRLVTEIELFRDNGTLDLLPYFFMCEELVDHYSQNRQLTGLGRGSAAGVLTAYLLGITHKDPITYELSLERFLTLDRIKSGAMPDLDLDFGDRDLLLNPDTGFLWQRFGDHASAISTDTLLRLKSSLKDVTRALHGAVTPEIESLCKSIGDPPQGIQDRDWIFGYKSEDDVEHPGLLQESRDLQAFVEQNPHDWDIVCKCLRCTRARSRHASGFVIANQPVAEFLPTTTISGVRTTQYTAASVEARGGLKVDLLAVNSLSDISDAVNLLQVQNGGLRRQGQVINGEYVPPHRIIAIQGQDYDIWRLPEDQAVFRDICEGNTETVFQFNTNAAKMGLTEFNYWKNEADGKKSLSSLQDLAAFTALDRPGPLDAFVTRPDGGKHNMLVEFARRARGLPAVERVPVFDEIMPETLGVITYQESLQKLYQNLTGCTGPEAEEFRRNIAKKKMEKVTKAYPGFMAAAGAKVGEEQAKQIWEKMVTFGRYGFNKSHAVCYAAIGYTCAFLKYHFPLIWWCAVLRNASKNEITEKFYQYCKQWLQPPDVQRSEEKFTIIDGQILAPLSYILGVGEKAHQELVQGRPYVDIKDFCEKVVATKKSRVLKTGDKWKMGTSALNSGVVKKLIIADVMDSLFPRGLDLIGKIEAYHVAIAEATQDLNVAMAALTGTKAKRVKPEKVSQQIINLSALNRYQVHKDLMPIGSGRDLIQVLADTNVHGIVAEKKKHSTHVYRPTDAQVLANLRLQSSAPEFSSRGPGGKLYFADVKMMRLLADDKVPRDPQRFVVAAYVVADEALVVKKTSSVARKFVLDIEGQQFEVVKWPRGDAKKVVGIPEGLKGAVVIAVMYQHSEKHKINLEALAIVSPAINLSEKEEENERNQSSEGSGNKTTPSQGTIQPQP